MNAATKSDLEVLEENLPFYVDGKVTFGNNTVSFKGIIKSYKLDDNLLTIQLESVCKKENGLWVSEDHDPLKIHLAHITNLTPDQRSGHLSIYSKGEYSTIVLFKKFN